MKAAIFLPNWLGDLVMATPVLRAVRRKFGKDARLVGIMRPYLADVLSGTDWLDEQWFFDPRAADRSQRAWAVANRMRRERFDLAILLTNSLPPALMAWWAGAKQRIGYVRYGRGPLLTHKLYPRRASGRIVPEPVVETYLTFADALGCGYESARLELAVTASEEDSADAVFKRLGLRRDGRLILLNSGSAYGAARVWPAEYFGRLARRVTEQCDHDVLVMCGPNERGVAMDIVKYADSPAGIFHGRSAPGSGHGKGLHPPRTIDGLHRQRSAARRRRAGKAGDYALRADAARVERKSHAAGDQPVARPGLHRLSKASLPAGTPSLHARTDRGHGVCRGDKDAG